MAAQFTRRGRGNTLIAKKSSNLRACGRIFIFGAPTTHGGQIFFVPLFLSPTRATSFVLELQAAVTQLQAHPGMGRAGRVPGTCELVQHKNYIAIYRVRGDVVEILRLHHAARNLRRTGSAPEADL